MKLAFLPPFSSNKCLHNGSTTEAIICAFPPRNHLLSLSDCVGFGIKGMTTSFFYLVLSGQAGRLWDSGILFLPVINSRGNDTFKHLPESALSI
jgi:hypothetical protein